MDKQKARYDRAHRFHQRSGSVTRVVRRGLVFVIGVVAGELIRKVIDRLVS